MSLLILVWVVSNQMVRLSPAVGTRCYEVTCPTFRIERWGRLFNFLSDQILTEQALLLELQEHPRQEQVS